MNRILVRLGLAVLLLALACGVVVAEPTLRLEAGATTHHGDDMASEPGFTFGGSLALARWAPSEYLALSPYFELLFARRNTSFPLAGGVQRAPLSMDSLELPFLLRGELTLGGRTFYALGGGYAGLLLRAQRMKSEGIIDQADTAKTTDVGLLLGAGFDLASFSWGELSSNCATSAAIGQFSPRWMRSPSRSLSCWGTASARKRARLHHRGPGNARWR